ncbi:efflux transporter outer membrane subunit [Brackiella oedipodis]|uniref:efflux transporter outer membrane subunit n=1 Tax=Brackiella oedipodis TaxID=124225 RepID=UPI0006847AC4|nr:efflux transporter outer membrane subunit [Brackiella oedipodis]
MWFILGSKQKRLFAGSKHRFLLSSATLMLLSACAVGPDYEAAVTETAADYKAVQEGHWQRATPADDLSKGNWWERFEDADLNALMVQLNHHNNSIAEAFAKYQAVQAQAKVDRAQGLPSISSTGRAQNRGGSNTSSGHDLSIGASAQWEIDLWGRIRRLVESGEAQEQASAADLANVRLSMQSDLAQAYFLVRMADAQEKLLLSIVRAYEHAVRTNQNQYDQGIIAKGDVVQAQTQLENAKAAAIDIHDQRRAQENRIAVLIGQAPANFRISQRDYQPHMPTIPVDLPSALLQRRPDIAAAERRMAAANADIGVAQSAWFPAVNLAASGSLQSSQLHDWLSSPLNVWALGPTLAYTIFNGGARQAQVAIAKANYQAQVAAYRQTVLNALQEVDTALNTANVLDQELPRRLKAVELASQSLQITRNQYDAGMIDYLSVVQVENTTHNTAIQTLLLQSQRLQNLVQLVKALGGGWDLQHDALYQRLDND